MDLVCKSSVPCTRLTLDFLYAFAPFEISFSSLTDKASRRDSIVLIAMMVKRVPILAICSAMSRT